MCYYISDYAGWGLIVQYFYNFSIPHTFWKGSCYNNNGPWNVKSDVKTWLPDLYVCVLYTYVYSC